MKEIYVVDTTVVMQYLLTETYTSHTIVLVQQLQQGTQLCIPEFCLLECANVFWKQVRFQGMPSLLHFNRISKIYINKYLQHC